jgi:hypothetical protein
MLGSHLGIIHVKSGGSLAVVTTLGSVNLALKDMEFASFKWSEFYLYHGHFTVVHDEKPCIVRSSQKFGFSTEAQANGAQNCRLSRTVGTYDHV